MSSARCDVAILGGGPAGAGVALALRACTGLSVALIERSDYHAPRIGETLPPDSRTLLTRLGVWSAFLQGGHLPSKGTSSCWGSPELGFNDYLMSPWGSGWHLDRTRFDQLLSGEVIRRGGAVHTATALSRWEALGPEGYLLHLTPRGASEWTLQARFVVDATGRKAAFAVAQGARPLVADRGLGVYGAFRVRPGQTFDTHTLVEACPEGWWYSALLPEGRVVVGLLGDGDSLRGVTPRASERWLSLLEQAPATRRRLDACDFAGEPLVAVPANVARLDRVHGAHWLTVGDASCTFDPLSSQGISKALRSSLLAAEAIERHLRGAPGALPSYAEAVGRQFQEHLSTRGRYYGMEQRWLEAPFWRNRARAMGQRPHASAERTFHQ
ncbi:tryptophan 7-halogenase [Hyalangium gracile]|uniref:tryptophan 7-halogenase n=1 Tax=Hyalangium gracile TaxID=394092 RepID=UPI001CCCEA66|nr:tryptophan 7-halogenase [Hyalangium gracile]